MTVDDVQTAGEGSAQPGIGSVELSGGIKGASCKRAHTRSGFITFETMICLTLLFFVFMGFMFFGFRLWIQVRTEDAATQIVREATRQDREPGETSAFNIFDGNGAVTIEWTDEYVEVEVDVKNGWHRAVRVLPREVL